MLTMTMPTVVCLIIQWENAPLLMEKRSFARVLHEQAFRTFVDAPRVRHWNALWIGVNWECALDCCWLQPNSGRSATNLQYKIYSRVMRLRYSSMLSTAGWKHFTFHRSWANLIEQLAQNPNLLGLRFKGQISNKSRKSLPQISILLLQIKSQIIKNYTLSTCSQTFKNTIWQLVT